ncbi:MAG TPA: hypothetical protein VLF40_01470, partial [Candidatus Saccharimonadales bacterium]|nr:hypothetical protein [Candidatus Saccharimonadales bacterium]
WENSTVPYYQKASLTGGFLLSPHIPSECKPCRASLLEACCFDAATVKRPSEQDGLFLLPS